MGTTPLLMRSRPALPSLSAHRRPPPRHQRRPHRRDRVRRAEGARRARASRLRADLQGPSHRGDVATTGSPAGQVTSTTARGSPCRRSTCPRWRTPCMTTRATRPASRPGGACRRSRRCRRSTTTSRCWRWSRTPTTASSSRRRRRGATCGPTQVRSASGRSPTRCPTSRSRSARPRTTRSADVVERGGLGRLMKIDLPRRQRGTSARRLPDGRLERPGSGRPPLRGVRQRGPLLHGLLGDPESLAVNPSLTISAVAERACEQLVNRAADYGLPAKPAGLRSRRSGRVPRPAHGRRSGASRTATWTRRSRATRS